MVDVLAVMGLGLCLTCDLVYGLGLRASIASPSTELNLLFRMVLQF
jgi:hypothetical protein